MLLGGPATGEGIQRFTDTQGTIRITNPGPSGPAIPAPAAPSAGETALAEAGGTPAEPGNHPQESEALLEVEPAGEVGDHPAPAGEVPDNGTDKRFWDKFRVIRLTHQPQPGPPPVTVAAPRFRPYRRTYGPGPDYAWAAAVRELAVLGPFRPPAAMPPAKPTPPAPAGPPPVVCRDHRGHYRIIPFSVFGFRFLVKRNWIINEPPIKFVASETELSISNTALAPPGEVARAAARPWPRPGPRTSSHPAAARPPLEPIIREAARRHRLPVSLIIAIIKVESNFLPQAVSPQGARGLMQLMPETAAFLGVKDPFCPRQNILAGCRYLRLLLDRLDDSLPLALAAYNSGHQRVVAAGYQVPDIKETRKFVTQVLGLHHLAERGPRPCGNS